MGNIWHDMSPKRITPTDFVAVIEIPKGSKKKYELDKDEPFVYYVYRRRIENANVRIVFACLLAGLNEQAIKARLRQE